MVKKSGKIIKLLIIFLIFIFAVLLRLWNFNQVGKTWDEDAYVRWGYDFTQLIAKADFNNQYWYKVSASPPLSSYLFGIPARYDINKFDLSGKPIFNYDYTHVRLVSVLFSSLTVVLIVLFGWRYISFAVGVFSGVILAMLPLFVGYSQLATLEALIIFFFTATIFSFFNYLTNPSKRNIVLTGILLGLSLEVKYTNIILIPLMLIIYLIWYFNSVNRRSLVRSLFLIYLIGFATFFVLWPMPWFHLGEVINFNSNLRNSSYSVPEVFFGRLMHVPKAYYFIYFLITTPIVVISLFLVGLVNISGTKFLSGFKLSLHPNKITNYLSTFFLLKTSSPGKWILYAITLWFIFPFIQSLYNFRQHGIRYIIEIYSPLALIAGIGLNYLLTLTKRKILKVIILVILITNLFVILIKITPYYLDYFNLIVGGTKGVYETKMFQMGWWGQGIREAGIFLMNNAPKNSRIGSAISPKMSLPPLNGLKVTDYQDDQVYDYVMVNYFHVIREGFNDANIKLRYKIVYEVKADGATIVTVYKRK
jgi:hypothetical protein